MADSDFFQLYHNYSNKEVDFVLSNEVICFINDIYEDKGTNIFKSYDCSNMDFEMKNKYLLVLNIYCRFYMASVIKKEFGEEFNTVQKEFFDSFVDRYSPILMVAILLVDKTRLGKVCLLAAKLLASSYEKIDKLYSQNTESAKMKILINDKKFVEIHNKFLDSISGDYNYEWTSKHTHQQYWIFSKEELTKCMDSIGVLDEKDIFTILRGWLELGIVKKNRNSPGIQLAVKRDSVIKKYYAILNTPIDNIDTNNDNGEIDEQ